MAFVPFNPSGAGGGSAAPATGSTPGAVKPADGLSVQPDGTLTVKTGTGLKLDANKNVVIDPATVDVTQLNKADTLVSGIYQGGLSATSSFATLANAQKGNWWNVSAAVTIGGQAFGVGDQLWCGTNVTGTPTNLNNFVRVPATMAQATATEAGIVQLTGDLGGSATTPLVKKIDGVSLPSAAPVAGQFLKATSGTATTWETPAAGVTLSDTAPANSLSTASAGTATSAARQDHVHRHPDSLHNGTRKVAQFTTGDYWMESVTANKSKITLSDTLVSASVENVLRFRADATDVRLSGPKGIDKAYAGTGAEGIGLSVGDTDFRVRHANLDMGGTDTALGGWYFKTKNNWGEFKLNEATNGVTCMLMSGKGGAANLAVRNGTRLWFDDSISTLEFNSANGTNNNVDKWSRLRCIRDNIESVVNGNTTLTVKQAEIRVAGELYPSGNGTRFLGWSGDRWKEIWCTQASINSSSDARLKTELESIPEALLDGWGLHVKWGSFNWLDLKDSRKQLGLIAQDVIKAFEYAGLDWKEWAAIAGNEELDKGGLAAMYGALQVIENAYQRRRLDRIEKALNL